jgi:hypothetical protein
MTKITHVGGGAAGEASHLSVQALSSTEILTTMQNGSGNLELIGWLVDGNKVTRGATATAGRAHEVALTLMGRRVVTAVRSGSGNLLLISWNASSGLKSIDRLHDSANHAGEASQIAMTAISSTILVTALRAGNGNLLLITWALNADGSFSRQGDSGSQAGAVSLVTVTSVGNNLVVTAVRNGSGNLELIAWKVAADGKTIHRQNPGGASAGAVGEIALLTQVPYAAATGVPGVITAVQNGAGDLLVIGWKILEDGAAIERTGDTSTLPTAQRPGAASHIAIGPTGSGSYLATMRNGSGNLELIVFDLAASGAWTRVGSLNESAADVTETAVASLYGRPVTVARRANFLNLAIWDISPNVFPTVAPPAAASRAPDTLALNHWFSSALADPTRARHLKDDWRKLLLAELPASDQQREHLSLVPTSDAQELQKAIAMTVDHGGTIHIERDSESSPGTLIVQPKITRESAGTANISIGVFHCTFDAYCKNWHCGWGPVRKSK